MDIESIPSKEELDKLWDEEFGKWEKVGMHPDMLSFDAFKQDMAINGLIRFLVDKEIIEDEDEFYRYHQFYTIEEAGKLRTEYAPQAIEARRRAEAVDNDMLIPYNRLLGPNGRPLKH